MSDTAAETTMAASAGDAPAEALLFIAAAPDDVDRLRATLPMAGIPGLRLGTRLPATALPRLAHAGTLDPDLPDLIVTMPLTADGPGALLDLVARHAAGARARLLVVRRHSILPGRDAVRLMFALRRLERLSAADFQSYWLHHHAPIGRKLLPPFSYHQLHALPAETAGQARAAGIPALDHDGVVEVHFPDVAALVAQLSRQDVLDEALADERNFIDHARSLFWAYAEAPD